MLERWRRVPKFSLAGGIAMGLVVLLFGFTTAGIEEVTRRNCRQLEVVKTEIRTVVGESLRTLGRPHTPGYAYYSTHPDELKGTRVALRAELKQFRRNPCN